MYNLRQLLLLLVLVVAGTAMAAPVSERQAMDMAAKFMASHSFSSVSVKMAHRAPMLGDNAATARPAYYVFNAGQAGNGFVIVAGDDRVPAILGYCDRGSFDEMDVPQPMQEWLDGYARQIQAIAAGGSPDIRSSSRAPIQPMLNVKWGQGLPYNVLLPHVPTSENAHAYVGCVAVAMAQVMSYWQYPSRPTKTIPGYTSNAGKTYAVTMPSLSPVDFDWENMQNTYYTNDSTSAECLAVATLMRYSTTAMQSSFGLTSTGSYTRNIPAKLIEYFGYKNSARYVYRESFTTQAWEDLIYNELAEGRPVAYGGNKQSAGHAFVCDGYDGEGRFHINWGWAGKSNGYFLLNLLNPSDEGIGSAAGAYGYVKGQGAAIGLMPDDGNDGEAAFSFEDLSISSSNNTRSAASANFSVAVSGRFVNKTNVTSQFRQGWGLYNLDGELLDVLFIRYTTSPIASGEYVSVNARSLSFGAGITSGTYRILPIYSIYPGEDYKPCIGADVNYIEVTFGGNYSCTIKGYGTAGSTTKYSVNNCTVGGTLNHGKPATVTLDLKNEGSSTNDMIYMFVDGSFNAMGLANIGAGESGDVVYRFTPTTAGSKTLTFSLNESGSSPFYTRKVTINTMPGATLDVSYRVLNITDEENRVITADHYTIIADVTNTGTAAYNEDFSVRLYRINNSDTNVGTELLNQSQPLSLAPGESTSLQFDFDHDLIDGWRYFCYLYYYSDGEPVGTGTRWYTINFPSEPVEKHLVTSMVNPLDGATVRFMGGVADGEAQVGKTVTFAVAPAAGFVISDVQAVDAAGNPVHLNLNASTGNYSFVMPSSDVAITVTALAAHHIQLDVNHTGGGRASLSTTTAIAGETITVTATPNQGWDVDGLLITASGTTIPQSAVGNGVYSFVMPDDDVSVSVNFSRSAGSLFRLVEARNQITQGDTYVLVSRNYDKVMKQWSDQDATFQATDVTEWIGEDKAVARVSDDACMFTMTQVADTTVSGNARTAAYLTTGNGFMRTGNYNVFLHDDIAAESRAWMYIGNASNCLIRFKDSSSGSNGNWIVRYDNQADDFKVMNWNVTGAEVSRVWLYKLVESHAVNVEVLPGDAATVTLQGVNVGNLAQEGETVYIDVTPAGDYVVDRVTVTTIDGDVINPEQETEEPGRYFFTMPAAQVTVSVSMLEPQGPGFLLGDVNSDGQVSIADVTAMIDYLLGGNADNINLDAADVNASQDVSIADVTMLIDMLLSGVF